MIDSNDIKLKVKVAELEMRIEQLEKLMTTTQEKKPYYTISEYAEIMNLTPMTVYNHVRSGDISAIRVGKSWRIPCSSLLV